MSFLTDIGHARSKSVTFIVKIFSRSEDVIAIISKLSAPTLAAMLAVFYDVLNFAQTETCNVETGNVTAILTPTTLTLLAKVVEDSKTAESVIAADVAALKALGQTVPAPKA